MGLWRGLEFPCRRSEIRGCSISPVDSRGPADCTIKASLNSQVHRDSKQRKDDGQQRIQDDLARDARPDEKFPKPCNKSVHVVLPSPIQPAVCQGKENRTVTQVTTGPSHFAAQYLFNGGIFILTAVYYYGILFI